MQAQKKQKKKAEVKKRKLIAMGRLRYLARRVIARDEMVKRWSILLRGMHTAESGEFILNMRHSLDKFKTQGMKQT